MESFTDCFFLYNSIVLLKKLTNIHFTQNKSALKKWRRRQSNFLVRIDLKTLFRKTFIYLLAHLYILY